ncbi:hypothetical protein [Rhizobium sp. R693]|uniref:hypothetical protein n=1 Tax=Rhizobium sp. R693 TaxID=1764276 RepID=UPI00167BBFA2|nr:hypothetical protein [Rhizobium sp. R693]
MKKLISLASAVAALALTAGSASAQQTTGTMGTPSATTTIDGRQLPPPDPSFGGVITNDAVLTLHEHRHGT